MALEQLEDYSSNQPLKNFKKPYLHFEPKVDYSLKKEISFVILSSIFGAITMFIPRIVFDLTLDSQYYILWLVFAKTLESNSFLVGIALHFSVATLIGIAVGIFLHKGIHFDISKLSNGLLYGIICGILVYVLFFIPVQQFVLTPNTISVLMDLNPSLSITEASEQMQTDFSTKLLDSYFTHLIWGISVGIVSSLLTRQLGANFRCHKCDIQFSKIETFNKHHKFVHQNPTKDLKKIIILGGGYAGVSVLRTLQKEFEDNVDVSISIVSKDNFFLHTPMLPEMATGIIEPRHIATPIRTFCKRARFYQAKVNLIDTNSKQIQIIRTFDGNKKILDYDYLVIAMGNNTNFFGNQNIEKNSLTIKSLGDAIAIRNHLISVLENADQEEDSTSQEQFCTIVVVGGGFSGVETAGELNDFVRESTEKFYRNIDPEKIKIILVSSKDRILPEIGDLGKYAFKSLEKAGVEIITNTKLVDAGENYATLDDGRIIKTSTIIWAGGNKVEDIIKNLECKHEPGGRIVTDEFLRIEKLPNIFALGDCSSVTDKKTGIPYPPTAQHALRQAKVAANNISSEILGKPDLRKPFDYDAKGSMAKIGKRDGVALLMGHKFQGFYAWFLWKQYYLATLPVTEKKVRVAIDWFIDLIFPKDITRLNELKERSFQT